MRASSIAAGKSAMNQLFCALCLLAAVTSEPLHAQETGPNYPVLTLVFGVAAAGSFIVYTNTHTCPAGVPVVSSPPSTPPTQSSSYCDTQETLKTGALALGIISTVGFVWSLLHINRVMNDRSGALLTAAPHKAPVIQPPDFSYDAQRRDFRVMLVHTTF